jgi:hypothetical protein
VIRPEGWGDPAWVATNANVRGCDGTLAQETDNAAAISAAESSIEWSFQTLAIDSSPNRTVDGRILQTMIGHGGGACNNFIGLYFGTCGLSSCLE